MVHSPQLYRSKKISLIIELLVILIILALISIGSSSGISDSEKVYVISSFQSNSPSHHSTVTMLDGRTLSQRMPQ